MSAAMIVKVFAVLLVSILITRGAVAADEQKPASPAADKASPAALSNRPITDKWALVIGVSRFQDPSIKLKYAAKDAMDFYDYLINHAHFAKDHVKLLVDEEATRENILNQLGDKWLPRVAAPEDLVLIYLSSHGSPSNADIGGLNFLVAHNTDKDSLYASGIPIQDLTRLIKDRVHAERIVVILDACHSGAVRTESKGLYRESNFNADEIAKGTGQLIICSSEPAQRSWESNNYPNGVFTRQFIESLKQKDGGSTLGEAFQMTRDRVAQEVLRDRGELQRPVLKSAWSGSELVLSAVPTAPRPGLEETAVSLVNRKNESQFVQTNAPAIPPAAAVQPLASASTQKSESSLAKLLDGIAPVWTVGESLWGFQYKGTWRWDRGKEEFDAVYDNGTMATIKIVQYDGHNIVMTSRNYAGKHKGHIYKYVGTCTANSAKGKGSWSNSIFAPMTWKWWASW